MTKIEVAKKIIDNYEKGSYPSICYDVDCDDCLFDKAVISCKLRKEDGEEIIYNRAKNFLVMHED